MVIAYRITGELENQEPLALGGEFYPLGQNIRGALGYAFLDMGLEEISKTYIQQVNPVLYFRDCLALCKCNGKGGERGGERGELIPLVIGGGGGSEGGSEGGGSGMIREVVYKCNKCGVISRNPVSKDKIMGTHISEMGTANAFVNDIISNRERVKFKFEVILKGYTGGDELSELMAAIKFIGDNGLYIGKRKNKGLGKMSLKHVRLLEIGMREISQRGDEIESKLKKDKGILTIRLTSDTIGNGNKGDDLVRDIKNTAKFFDKDWHEYRDAWKDPIIKLIGKNTELSDRDRKIIHFLDCKVRRDSLGGEIEDMKINKVDLVISRGTQLSYQLYDIDRIDSSFYNALAMTEMCRGIGDRTSFGKGSFMIT